MIKADPIIAVKDVQASSQWYQALLGCKDIHEGGGFAILTDENNEVLLCLHQWDKDEHPTMIDPSITLVNGLILYFRTNDLDEIRVNAEKLKAHIEEEVHLNPNTSKDEFSLRDRDNYFLTISMYHVYKG